MLQAFSFLGGDNPAAVHGGRCGGRIQQCWEFEHPRRDSVVNSRGKCHWVLERFTGLDTFNSGLPITNSHNARSAVLNFSIPNPGILHGFAGYFEAVLYDNIGLSIHPDRKDLISKDMLSWFPCFFPIKVSTAYSSAREFASSFTSTDLQEPLYLPSDSELRVSLWRLNGPRKVWYEWYAEVFIPVSPVSSQSHSYSAASPAAPSSPASRINGVTALSASIPASFTVSPVTRSPMLDAIDLSFASERSVTPDRDDISGIVKIGQTSLHNPGGRSSWYGL